MRRVPTRFWYGAIAINLVLVAFELLSGHPSSAVLPVVCAVLAAIPIGFDKMSK